MSIAIIIETHFTHWQHHELFISRIYSAALASTAVCIAPEYYEPVSGME